MTSLPCLHDADGQGDRSIPACIDRRRFLASTGLAGVAALLASACGDGEIGNTVTAPGGSGTTVVTLADYPALAAVGGIARISGTTRPIAVVRAAGTTYRAFSLVCPHQGSTVEILGGTSFQCPNHGARFAASGQWTGGEPTGNLTELTATLDGAGTALTVRF